MRTPGSPAELERRRSLAIRRIREGHPVEDVAEMLDVTPRSIRRWITASETPGQRGLRAKAVSGRPPHLDHTQEKVVRRWLSRSPLEHGFTTDLWTAKRLATLIRQTWDVSFNHRYLCEWLGQRGYSPQKPQRVPRERNDQAIRGWCHHDWPRIQKKSDKSTRTLCSLMKVAC